MMAATKVYQRGVEMEMLMVASMVEPSAEVLAIERADRRAYRLVVWWVAD